MKLKSLLLGSAAVLALSTGAQAADPIVEFVSLGVCDTYGITGLTIESDDTCLSISGSVEYEYEIEDTAAGTTYASDLDWELIFEAATQTDAGAAIAHIGLVDSYHAAWGEDLNGNGAIDVNELVTPAAINVDEAYVRFGDTTVLSAGLKESIFDFELVDDLFTIDDDEAGDSAYSLGIVGNGGHVIQIESLIADGFTVMASLEDLDDHGTAGLGVAYDNAGISGELGVLVGDLYGEVAGDQMTYYGKVMAEFDAFAVNAGFIADDDGEWVATIGADATFDMFRLNTEAYFDNNDQWGIAGEGTFDATDKIEVYVGSSYQEIINAATLISGERWKVYGGVNADVAENIALNAEIGYVDDTAAPEEYLYGLAGVTYAPGGGFETSLEGEVRDNDHYRVTFNASKEF